MRFAELIAFILEWAPMIRHSSASHYIRAKKPGDEEARRPRVNLARRRGLFGFVSVVVPCSLSKKMLLMYGDYIHEIIIVNDNGKDRTSEVAREMAKREPRIKVLDRQPPNGSG
jgi:hypothetical protein